MSEFSKNSGGGIKHTGNKAVNHHVPRNFVLDLAEHMAKMNRPTPQYPNGKYPHGNWKLGMKESQCLDAAQRHLEAIIRGEYIDQETGSPHIIAVAANAMMFHMCETLGRLEKDGDAVYIDRINNEVKNG